MMEDEYRGVQILHSLTNGTPTGELFQFFNDDKVLVSADTRTKLKVKIDEYLADPKTLRDKDDPRWYFKAKPYESIYDCLDKVLLKASARVEHLQFSIHDAVDVFNEVKDCVNRIRTNLSNLESEKFNHTEQIVNYCIDINRDIAVLKDAGYDLTRCKELRWIGHELETRRS